MKGTTDNTEMSRSELLQIVLEKRTKQLSQAHPDWPKVFQNPKEKNNSKDSTEGVTLDDLPRDFITPLIYVHQSKNVSAETLAKIHQFAKQNLQTPLKEIILEMIGKYIANVPHHAQHEIVSNPYWKHLFQNPDSVAYAAVRDHLKLGKK